MKFSKTDKIVILTIIILVSVFCLWKNDLWQLFVCLGIMALMSYFRTIRIRDNHEGRKK